MTMERWDPFQEMMTLRDAMDRLFRESYVRPGRAVVAAGGGMLPLDVREDHDRYVVQASLPGVRPDDVEITVHGNTLSIRAQQRSENEGARGGNWIVRERSSGVMQRSLTLPVMIDAGQADARFEHGELILTLPKAEEARPRRIQVGAGAGTAGARQTDRQTTGQDSPNTDAAAGERRGQPLGATHTASGTEGGASRVESGTMSGTAQAAGQQRSVGETGGTDTPPA